MATFTELAIDQAQVLGRRLGCDVTAVAGIPAGSVNSNYRLTLADGTALFARVYEEQDTAGAESEARLLDHLARNGVATPRPLAATRDGSGFTVRACETGRARRSRTARRPRPVALFPWRDGEILCQARVTPEAARKVGEKLAEVHLAGPTFRRAEAGALSHRRPARAPRAHRRGRDAALRALVPEIARALDRAERERDPESPARHHSRRSFSRQRALAGRRAGRPARLRERVRRALLPTISWSRSSSWCYGDDFDERSRARDVRRVTRPSGPFRRRDRRARHRGAHRRAPFHRHPHHRLHHAPGLGRARDEGLPPLSGCVTNAWPSSAPPSRGGSREPHLGRPLQRHTWKTRCCAFRRASTSIARSPRTTSAARWRTRARSPAQGFSRQPELEQMLGGLEQVLGRSQERHHDLEDTSSKTCT